MKQTRSLSEFSCLSEYTRWNPNNVKPRAMIYKNNHIILFISPRKHKLLVLNEGVFAFNEHNSNVSMKWQDVCLQKNHIWEYDVESLLLNQRCSPIGSNVLVFKFTDNACRFGRGQGSETLVTKLQISNYLVSIPCPCCVRLLSFSVFIPSEYALGTNQNHLSEVILISAHSICFKKEFKTKIWAINRLGALIALRSWDSVFVLYGSVLSLRLPL